MDQVLLDQFLAECGLTDPFRVEVGLKGDPTTQIHEFRQPFLVIGRRAGSDMMLDHWLVSRRHAYLQLIEGRFFCVDLGSRTGTHGGDATERSGWLEPGRAIQIGPYFVRPELPPTVDRDYPPLPVITWSITSPTEEPSFWTMNRGLALIGRSPACRIRLPEADVSRFHCSLVLTTSGVWAVNLLSQREVFVNGQSIRLSRIGPGDQLRIGNHTLTPEYDIPLRKPTQRTSLGSPPAATTVVASTRPPDPSTDHLPALSPTVLPPGVQWESPGSFHLPDKATDQTVSSLVQHFGAMQQQMLDQFHQMMMSMFEGFAALHRETSEAMRDEVEEVRRQSREIEELRAEIGRVAEVTTLSMQQDAFAAADAAYQDPFRPPEAVGVNRDPNHPQNGHALRAQPPAGPPAPPRPEPPPKVVIPPPDPHVDAHAQLFQRLKTIESERQTRWQKILAMMAKSS